MLGANVLSGRRTAAIDIRANMTFQTFSTCSCLVEKYMYSLSTKGEGFQLTVV